MAPKKTKKRAAEGANSNVFSMFEQAQIQEFKEAFTIMDQNRDGFIDKNDLRDTFAALGRLNVKQEEIDDMLKEASGPVNFTVFLTMFGEKLKGADPEETILNAFKVFDPEGKGILKKEYVTQMLTTQADRFSAEEVRETVQVTVMVSGCHGYSDSDCFLNRQMEQMFAAFPPDATGNLDYNNLVHIITHGEDKDQE
ncbi:Myosin regulatory light chain 2, ventricular/cardiac muscle isoform [Triplophysa tibetana]|uniref:Myosin regulatory light chain 2, ventricular/cardiac muscle isoform n=1 Tax=Triplophysa tibetana TaxID=1572043 RepID=A0A5A9P657_9TELE|nr:Myosin regulatory light chain 2, ventricular/cardiac muscle isoform [Triplophysa tibetana]